MQTALKVECAKLFCLDVRREVPVAKIQVCLIHLMVLSLILYYLYTLKPMITKILRHDAKDKFKVSQALAFCQKRMNTFRSDEKNKVNMAVSIIFIIKSLK